jgi:hypothetical protein
VAELAPVGRDHVGRRRQAGRAPELGHHLAAGEAVLGAARVLGVGDDAAHVAHQADRVLQEPAAVRVERDAGGGEAFVQRLDGLDLFLGAQGAALQLEVVEAVARVRGFGEPDDRVGGERLFVAKAQPVVVAVGGAGVRQVGPGLVADVEQVAEHLDRVALLAFAEQRRDRNAEVLAEQVEQRRFDGGDGVDRRAQVERLLAAAAAVAIGKARVHLLQQPLPGADRLADDDLARVFERLPDLLAARHLADAGAAGAVGGDQQVAREERAVRAAQVEQHAVAAGDRDDAQSRQRGGRRSRSWACAGFWERSSARSIRADPLIDRQVGLGSTCWRLSATIPSLARARGRRPRARREFRGSTRTASPPSLRSPHRRGRTSSRRSSSSTRSGRRRLSASTRPASRVG